MRVTRIISKEVNECQDCPYYFEDRDMSSTLHGCLLLGDLYDALFKDNSYKNGIYDKCPYKAESETENLVFSCARGNLKTNDFVQRCAYVLDKIEEEK